MSVTIRRPSLSDAPKFLAAVERSQALHTPWVFAPADEFAFRAYVSRLDGDRHDGWLIEDRGGELVGVVNANEIVRGAFWNTYLGYYAFEPLAGTGMFTAGMQLVLDTIFDDLGLHRVEANIQPGNDRSIALVQRLGFRREGFSPEYLRIDGIWRDHERWALLVDEWRDRTA